MEGGVRKQGGRAGRGRVHETPRRAGESGAAARYTARAHGLGQDRRLALAHSRRGRVRTCTAVEIVHLHLACCHSRPLSPLAVARPALPARPAYPYTNARRKEPIWARRRRGRGRAWSQAADLRHAMPACSVSSSPAVAGSPYSWYTSCQPPPPPPRVHTQGINASRRRGSLQSRTCRRLATQRRVSRDGLRVTRRAACAPMASPPARRRHGATEATCSPVTQHTCMRTARRLPKARGSCPESGVDGVVGQGRGAPARRGHTRASQ
jgi:hypothetical protein